MARSTQECIQAVLKLDQAMTECHATAKAIVECLGSPGNEASGTTKDSFFTALDGSAGTPTIFRLSLQFEGVFPWGHEFALQRQAEFTAYESWVSTYSLGDWMTASNKQGMANKVYSPASEYYAHRMEKFVNLLRFDFPTAIASKNEDEACRIAADLFGGPAKSIPMLQMSVRQGLTLNWTWYSRKIV